MEIIADLQLHSKYSRAVSQQMVLPEIARWARVKGIGLVATGDWTHPMWLREIKENLEEVGNGLLRLKDSSTTKISSLMNSPAPPKRRRTARTSLSSLAQTTTRSEILSSSESSASEPLFLLSTEISSIYSQGGKGRRIHTLFFVPSLMAVDRINSSLSKRGCNLMSDGRPIVGLSAKELTDIILDIEPKALVIPAHCLLPKTPIHINSGTKDIDKIKKDDKVLTHRGRFRRVTQVYQRPYKGKVYTVKPWYFRLGLTTTDEHPFLAMKTVKKCRSTGDICRPVGKHINHCRAKHYQSYRQEWIAAKNLEVGDILLFPRINSEKKRDYINIADYTDFKVKNGLLTIKASRLTKIKNKIRVDKSFCRLIGYYLAEGYVDKKGGISFAFSNKERGYLDDVKSLMKKVFGLNNFREYQRKNHQSIELIYYSKIAALFLSKFCYQANGQLIASQKKLPEFFLTLPKELQVEVIRGWWRGDRGYTSSRTMMNQLKIILLRLGIIPSILKDSQEAHAKRGKHKLEKRYIKANNDSYYFSHLSFFADIFGLLKEPEFASFKSKLDRRHGWIDKDYVYLPIRDIEIGDYEGLVYNLEIKQDNSYVSEFACVHNCWTPWFSLYGSKSGFDSIEECFGNLGQYIYAIETGLSSDPIMNWQIRELRERQIVSFSDAHSGPKLGREATVFKLKELSYKAVREAIMGGDKGDKGNKIVYTIEFYPEEGKYHYSGHRNCGVIQSPEETGRRGGICHICGKPLTLGVMHRVQQLARDEGQSLDFKVEEDKLGVKWVLPPDDQLRHRPFVSLVPLLEILAEVLVSGVNSQTVQNEYQRLIKNLGTEFAILLRTPIDKIGQIGGEKVAQAIRRVRGRKIKVSPGYDGVFGTVKIFGKGADGVEKREQMSLF